MFCVFLIELKILFDDGCFILDVILKNVFFFKYLFGFLLFFILFICLFFGLCVLLVILSCFNFNVFVIFIWLEVCEISIGFFEDVLLSIFLFGCLFFFKKLLLYENLII